MDVPNFDRALATVASNALRRSIDQFSPSRSFEDLQVVSQSSKVVVSQQKIHTVENPDDVTVFEACKAGQWEKAMDLIYSGHSINSRGVLGWTALHMACWKGKLAVVKQLIAAGALVDAQNDLGSSPLHCAVHGGHLEVAKYLVQKGGDYNWKNFKNESPLDYAQNKGHRALTEYLMSLP
jgi:ankyrin repeat protein